MIAPEVAAWPPTRYSVPLVADVDGRPVYSDGPALIRLAETAYRLPNGKLIVLDGWQKDLICSVLELFPPGHKRAGQLRYRQVLISVARQSSKSILASIFALYGIFRESGALVVGVASNKDQAGIVFKGTLTAIKSDKGLAGRFRRMTSTRGLETKDNSEYMVKATKTEGSVQGLSVSLGLVDELHLFPSPNVWSDLVTGTKARANGLVLGITTAGDDNSKLLIQLYKFAESPPSDRFGFFIWEAEQPEDNNIVPEDDETFARYLMQACPALACGRLDLETAISDARGTSDGDIIRYNFNRFTAANTKLLSDSKWQELASEIPKLDRPVFTFTLSEGKDWITVTAGQLIDGVTYTETVVSRQYRDLAQAVRLAEKLWEYSPARFVIERNGLGELVETLDKRGYPVSVARFGDKKQVSKDLVSLVRKKRLKHDGHISTRTQMATTYEKHVGAEWYIASDNGAVDAVYGVAYSAFYAEIVSQESALQIF